MPFELDNLDAYDDESIVNEMQRVANLVGDQSLTRNLFDTHSKVASSTIVRRFGLETRTRTCWHCQSIQRSHRLAANA